MRITFMLSVVLALVGCNRKTQSRAEVGSNDSSNVEEFARIDTISVAEFVKCFKEEERKRYNIAEDSSLSLGLDSSNIFWKNKRLWLNDSLVALNICGYPKSYKRINEDIFRVTTVCDSEYAVQIRLYTLDDRYQTIDMEVLTSRGGDEGIWERTFGYFKNDSVYAATGWTSGWDTDSIEHVVNMCLMLRKNGVIDEDRNCR